MEKSPLQIVLTACGYKTYAYRDCLAVDTDDLGEMIAEVFVTAVCLIKEEDVVRLAENFRSMCFDDDHGSYYVGRCYFWDVPYVP